MIHFEEITNKNIWDVCHLCVREDQKSFVADNIVSLAEAYATRNEGNIAMPFAIYDDKVLIGFVMLGYGTIGEENEPVVAKDNYVLWRFMLDQRYQHQGYAKKCLDEVVRYVRTNPFGTAEYIWLSYEPENIHGKNVYKKYGFVENKERCGQEIVAVLKL